MSHIYCDDCGASSNDRPIHAEEMLCNPCRDERKAATEWGSEDWQSEACGRGAWCTHA